MSSLFPLRGSVEHEQREPRLVELDEDTADEVFETLAARTTREIFLELHREPQTASDIADATDTSVQNAQYHLEKLGEADLIEVVDTWYSERGTEMNVYAPTDESLVLFAGEDTERSLGSVLKRLAGALGFLVPASVLVGLVTRQTIRGGESVGRGDDGVEPPLSRTSTARLTLSTRCSVSIPQSRPDCSSCSAASSWPSSLSRCSTAARPPCEVALSCRQASP
jgi:DNA-binding transcriptional ArsR family regulator